MTKEVVDVHQLLADDELLDSLGRVGSTGKDQDQAAALLRAWRESVDSKPIADLVDVDLAKALIGGTGA